MSSNNIYSSKEDHFTVYKTTNLINNKFYIGVHKTKNPNDSYLGSGIVLKASIEKYGRENFIKEILFDFSSYEEAFEKEKELVANHPNSMNISIGGKGGWSWDRSKKQISVKDTNGRIFRIYKDDARLISKELIPHSLGFKHSEQTKYKWSELRKGRKISEAQKEKHRSFRHSEITKLELSNLKIGNKSLSGRKWYNNGTENFCLFPSDDKTKTLIAGKINVKRKSGYTLSEQAKQNISKNTKGKLWFNDGIKSYMLYACDDKIITLQLVPGRLKWKDQSAP